MKFRRFFYFYEKLFMSSQSTDLSNFKFSMPVPIRWNDMDALGHINNVLYFEYFQIARGEYMNTASKSWDWTKHMFVIAHIECDYFKEINPFTKDPVIKTRVSGISNKSFDMEYAIVSTGKDGEQVLHAIGKNVNVYIDMTTKKSETIPDWLREELSHFEGL